MREPEGGLGGFIGLDHGFPCWGGASPSSWVTARVALGKILDLLQPRRVLLPRYICPVIFDPINERQLEVSEIRIDERSFRPLTPTGLRDDDVLLAVNYFGLMDEEMDHLADTFGERLIIDDSQALFHRPRTGSFAFTCLRKFLPVPDGAWLLGPQTLPEEPPNTSVTTSHLWARGAGQPDAHALFCEHEIRLNRARGGMSEITRCIVASLDLTEIAKRRRRNYQRMHALLGPSNSLEIAESTSGVPLYYPWRPAAPVRRIRFHERNIWVPCLWPGIEPDQSYPETAAVDRLLPLPLDQRLEDREIDHIAAIALELLDDE